MTIHFTSDTHFGHSLIIELAKRPFKDVEEMDRVMIARWNAAVRPDDTVYHLGDFSFQDQADYLHKLNGTKHLIKGNHDHRRRMSVSGWASISDMHQLKLPDGTMVVLCHYGMRVWNKSGHGALHFYGHSHNGLPGDSQSCDVGVDCWLFAPVTLEMIRKRLETLPKRTEPDHHGKKTSTEPRPEAHGALV